MTFVQPARLLMALATAIALPAMAQNLAIVNGKPIPSARADTMIKQLQTQGQPESPELRAMVREELINREILMQEANRRGITKDPDVQNQFEIARQSIAIRALVQDVLEKNPISDAEIKAEYDKFKAQSADKEYNARHILVETEDQAKESKDPGSAANGGSLGWAPPNAFVEPFSKAMVALKEGEITQAPVQTQYGYHVIKLDGVREAEFPALEEVKPQIAESLQQQKLQAFQDDLRKKAKIQ